MNVYPDDFSAHLVRIDAAHAGVREAFRQHASYGAILIAVWWLGVECGKVLAWARERPVAESAPEQAVLL